jgi:predicted metalloprotease with PDZ domain
MTDLSKRFGKNKPFKDDELFDVIAQMTYPEIREFFSMYVEGSNPLPLKEMFRLAGVTYKKSGKERGFTLGQVSLNLDQSTGKILVYDTSELNEFGKDMGYNKGDEILTVNGKTIDAATYGNIVQEIFANSKEGDILKMEVLRNGKVVKLKAPMMKVEKETSHVLSFDGNASESQLQIREAWLGKN